MEAKIINKVAESGIVTLDLAEYYPKGEIIIFDLQPYLFMGLILKEKDYRAALVSTDWTKYANKHVAINCTADAIIPMWAYMLAVHYLQPIADSVFYGTEQELINAFLNQEIAKINGEDYADKRVVVKGCGDVSIPVSAYISITAKLKPFVKSLMYGEPCSTVPIFKKGATPKE